MCCIINIKKKNKKILLVQFGVRAKKRKMLVLVLPRYLTTQRYTRTLVEAHLLLFFHKMFITEHFIQYYFSHKL